MNLPIFLKNFIKLCILVSNKSYPMLTQFWDSNNKKEKNL